jgi:hypothetical protein
MLGGPQPPCTIGSPRVFGLTTLRRRIWFISASVITTALAEPNSCRSPSILDRDH